MILGNDNQLFSTNLKLSLQDKLYVIDVLVFQLEKQLLQWVIRKQQAVDLMILGHALVAGNNCEKVKHWLRLTDNGTFGASNVIAVILFFTESIWGSEFFQTMLHFKLHS